MNYPSLLAEKHKFFSELFDILTNENKHLLEDNANPDQWSSVVDRKKELCITLDKLEASRKELLIKHKLEDTLKDSIRIARHYQCEKTWDDILELTRQCADLNILNGNIISQIMKHNSNVLETLTIINGQRIYGSNGQHESSGSRLSIEA